MFYPNLVLILALVTTVFSEKACAANQTEMLISFHPHLDAFWLNTDTQLTNLSFVPPGFLYQMNQRNSKTIFNSMLAALTQATAAKRKHFVTEVFFLKDWYLTLNLQQKQQVKTLITNGNLQIANSGWIENDEAVCYYDDIIEQYTVGMNFMYQQFGYVNEVGWATDCFGHSNSQAALLHELGFMMQGVQRGDERYVHKRNGGPLLEYFWKTKSDSNNRTYSGLLTHIRYFLHEVNDYRHTDQATTKQEYKKVTSAMKKLYEKNLLFRFLGNDFEEYIPKQFQFLENVMKKLNDEMQCQAYHYGNPTDYLIKLKKFWKQTPLRSRQYDLMPNWDHDRYWTGYYTTYPNLKKKCKQSSIILNVFRKALLESYLTDKLNLDNYLQKLLPIEQTVAILQHHDGITATSKHHIEEQMIRRLDRNDLILMQDFKQLKKISSLHACNFIKDHNQCVINEFIQNSELYFEIYNYGTPKKERIQIIFPNGKFYKLKNQKDEKPEIFCFEIGYQNCRLVLELTLTFSKNQFILEQTTLEIVHQSIILPVSMNTENYGEANFKIQQNYFLYSTRGHFYKIALFQSSAVGEPRSTVQWDKFGVEYPRTEFPSSGLYIMFNNGILRQLGKATDMLVLKGRHSLKIVLKFDIYTMKITANSQSLHILDILTEFQPNNLATNDYFLKFETDVVFNDGFYHDANGYLVNKRKLNYRPDYQFKIIDKDRINSNTYPATSFVYMRDEQLKFVVGTDRAQGVSSYDSKSLIVNIDRITGQDGKGAAQPYQFLVKNSFRHKIALVKSDDDIERKWQKNRDQGLFGFYGVVQPSLQPNQNIDVSNLQNTYLKYTVAFLNNHTLVLRIQNLAQNKTISLKIKEQQNEFDLKNFNIKIPYKDFKQSFLNGIPLKTKYKWIQEVPDSIQIYKNTIDNGVIMLQPLQIRSFRIDFTQKIADYKSHTEIMETKQSSMPIEQIKTISENMVERGKHLIIRKKRCF